MKVSSKTPLLLAALSAGLTGISSSSSAQEAGFEEVVVTAQKHEQSLQDYNADNTPTTALVVDDVYQPYGIFGNYSNWSEPRTYGITSTYHYE